MKKITTLSLLILLFVTISNSFAQTIGVPCADLFFSEYVEPGTGHSGCKLIEIYNPTPNAINLAGYTIKQLSKSSAGACATVIPTFTFPAKTLNAGDVYVINGATGTMTGVDSSFIIPNRDTVWGSMNFNGNDALFLIAPNNDTLDIFGIPCTTPNIFNCWYLGSDSTKDMTLVRKPTIHNGSINWANAANEWTGYAVNTLSNIGSHNMTSCSAGTTPILNFIPNSAVYGEAAGTVTVPITLSNPNPTTITIQVVLNGGTATAGSDFTYATQNVTFPISTAASQTQNVSFSIIDDVAMETSETAILTITNIAGGAINGQDSSFVLTINDNDTPTPPSVRFIGGSSNTSVESVGSITLTIGILNPNANPTSVNVVLTGGTATNGTDFTYTTPTTVTFPANASTNQTITIPITDDAIVEASETMTFTLTNPTNTATVASPANFTQTITDNDTPASTSVVTFATTTDNKSESAGSVSATFTITNPTSSAITVNLSTSGTATFGTDYGFITSNPVTIPANATTFTFLMNITDDAIVESTETAVVKIASVSTGSIGTDSVFTLSITDNDGLAINTLNNNNAITVAPNPVAANGTVFVKTNTTDKNIVFELYNILGVKVVTEMVQQNRVNLNGKNLNTGVYFYKVISNQEVLTTGRMMLK